MVVILNQDITASGKETVRNFIAKKYHREVKEVHAGAEVFFCIMGSTDFDPREIELQEGVQRVLVIHKPYKLCSREMKPENTIVRVGSHVQFGNVGVAVIAGPCSVESRAQILETAHLVRESGACMLRGGAYKPRSSPYSFQGLGRKGLEYLKEASEATGLAIVSEIVSADHIEIMTEHVDMLQIGARNMQNFELLKVVAAQGGPVLLKRGLAATIEEWLMAAEYLIAHGTQDVVLCERGIRTFETYTRNSLDITSIPVVKKLTHLPVLVDPSHATGLREKVLPVSLAAIAAGADGLMIEVHPQPEQALSDGPQSLYPQQFEKLMRDIEVLAPLVSREILRIPHKDTLLWTSRTSSKRCAAFQGQHGSYSEQALRMFFQDELAPIAYQHFHEVFKAVQLGEVDFAVLPIENSLMGTIHSSYDMFSLFPDLAIVGELYLRIEHSLIGVAGTDMEDIHTVYSQMPGFEQCRAFLAAHPEWELIPHYDTAGSVAKVAELNRSDTVAIANERTAAIHNLQVLAQGIETNPRNYTRFVAVSRDAQSLLPHPDKASMVFQTADKPGALFHCLQIAADRSLNLKKIESRPIQGKPWQYRFYLDLELPQDEKKFQDMVSLLKDAGNGFHLIGKYKADLIP